MMRKNNNPLEHLELVYEMNRLFVSFLQHRLQHGFDGLGLPVRIGGLLRAASAEQLDRAAALPHALFRLDLELTEMADAPMQRESKQAIALYCLQISLLQSARNLCRQNAHLAQTFLGLPATTLIRLRCLNLSELANIAETACLVRASFAAEPWLWREVLNTDAEEDQLRLRLIALQPRAEDLTAMPARA